MEEAVRPVMVCSTYFEVVWGRYEAHAPGGEGKTTDGSQGLVSSAPLSIIEFTQDYNAGLRP